MIMANITFSQKFRIYYMQCRDVWLRGQIGLETKMLDFALASVLGFWSWRRVDLGFNLFRPYEVTYLIRCGCTCC